MLPCDLEKNLELLQLQGDNSVVLLAWAVMKTSVDGSDNTMDYCNNIACELVKKNVFQSLHNFLTSQIFLNCTTGDLVAEGVFRVMAEFIKICADYAYLHEQEGVCYLTAELVNRKGLVVLDYLGPIFQLSLDAFPFVFNPFLEMCKSLLAIPDHYFKIIRLLKTIPGFLSEIPWTERKDSFNLLGDQKLFIDSDLFIMPKGTLVERFRYQGNEFARFIYPFDFFLLMEQFITSLSIITFEIGKSWYCFDNLTELVIIGYQFILHIIKHYKGNFKADTTLRKLVQKLEIAPTQYADGPMKNFKFLRLYFETNVTLVSKDMLDFSEAFPLILQRQFFPQVARYSKITKQIFVGQIYNESTLFKCLREEETLDDHTLLIEYLKLILKMVEKNVYHKEIQVAGLWYLLNIAFPLYQQWPYKDERQNYRTENNKDAYEVFKLCRDGFFHEEVLWSGFLSTFYKDKFHLQNLMEQESNWIGGPILEYFENIRLQMVLLLLVYRLRRNIKDNKTYVVDDKIGLITKAVSAYMVNPYKTSLRILSFRFLEVLAGDDSVPLLALLGLDYDQVQRLFLDKLRDIMEDDTVKTHILELISNCIFNQHGMTAAFFNVTRSRRWYSDNREKTLAGDTVTDFMIDYLQNIKKSHEYLKSPLQLGILRVMTNLWQSKKQHLIKDVIALDAFWPLLADPLFKDFNQAPSVYAYILKILSMQLNDLKTKDQKFLKVVEKFLTSKKQLTLWQKYIFKILSECRLDPLEIEEKDKLLKAWMEFILRAKKQKEIIMLNDHETKFLFVQMCLDGFRYSLANMHCLETWINLSLITISDCGLHYQGKDRTVTDKINDMFNIIRIHYEELSYNSRTCVLSIAHHVLVDLRPHFQSSTLDLLQYLEHLGVLLDHEHTLLEDKVWKELKSRGHAARELVIPWTLCINIYNLLLTFENIIDCRAWFSYRSCLTKMIKCACDLASIKETVVTLAIAKLVIRNMTLYVESPLALDFLNINMIKFYDCIEPIVTNLLYGQGNRLHPVHLDEGWIMATVLMRFNQAFLKRFQYTALPSLYTFLLINEQMLQHIIYLPETAVSIKALNLLLHTLTFFHNMFRDWRLEWYRKSNNTYNFVVSGTKRIVNGCLYTILRPKNIVIYQLDYICRLNQMEKTPMTLMASVMNRLITAAGLAFSILYKTNPSLVGLLDPDIPDTRNIQIINDFSVPKFELPIPTEFTYGKLLCLAHFLCKTLDALTLGDNPPVVEELPEQELKDYMCLVEHQDSTHNLPHQKLSAFLRYAMYEYSGLADPWIEKLDWKQVKGTLECLMFYLAQQVFLYITTGDNREGLPYYKRNLASELQFFYEHVRRHTTTFLKDQPLIISSVRSISYYRMEMDIMRKYLVYCKNHNETDDTVDNNFCIVITHWFQNICYVR